MTTDDTYNGWANRETWATALYLGNDEGTYRRALDIAHDSISRASDSELVAAGSISVRALARQYAADALREWFEELAADVIDGEASRDVRAMLEDVGSRWRVEWADVADGYIDEAVEALGDDWWDWSLPCPSEDCGVWMVGETRAIAEELIAEHAASHAGGAR